MFERTTAKVVHTMIAFAETGKLGFLEIPCQAVKPLEYNSDHYPSAFSKKPAF